MREYQGGRITRETELLCIEPFSSLANTLCAMVSSTPSLPDSSPVAYFVRNVILPTDSNRRFYSRLLHDFKMINRCMLSLCVIFDRLEIKSSFSSCGVLLKIEEEREFNESQNDLSV